jgi:hypothetical protein
LFNQKASSFQASLVCKNLGYFDAITFTQDSFFGQVSGQFSYCNVKCSGFESQLFECSHSDVNDCTSLEGAGVKCEVGNSKLSQSFLSPFPNQTKGGFEQAFRKAILPYTNRCLKKTFWANIYRSEPALTLWLRILQQTYLPPSSLINRLYYPPMTLHQKARIMAH